MVSAKIRRYGLGEVAFIVVHDLTRNEWKHCKAQNVGSQDLERPVDCVSTYRVLRDRCMSFSSSCCMCLHGSKNQDLKCRPTLPFRGFAMS